MTHATLSPSASDRWLNCPGGLLPSLEVQDVGSEYAAEGTLAHEWLEKMCKGEETKELLITDSEMYKYVSEAFEYIVTNLEGQLPASEQIINIFTVKDETCYGTVDAWGIVGDILHIFDFKYGQGIKVYAKDNSQMMLYAYGILKNTIKEHRVTGVIVHIVQPRMNNFSFYSYPVTYLTDWIADYALPTATLAITGKGAVVAGTHCRFCRIKGKCKATSFINEIENNYKALNNYEELGIDEKILIARKGKTISKWLETVSDQLLADVKSGEITDSRIEIIQTKGRTKITDEVRAAEILKEAGVMNYSRSSLLPYGQLKRYADILAEVIETPMNDKLCFVSLDESDDNEA